MHGGWRPVWAQGRARRVLAAGAAVLDRGPLGVQVAELRVESLSDHGPVADQHRADHRVGADPPAATLGELECSSKPSGFLFSADRGHVPPLGAGRD